MADDDSGSDAGGFCSLINFPIPVGESRVLVVTATRACPRAATMISPIP
jgi:hypothetical protein